MGLGTGLAAGAAAGVVGSLLNKRNVNLPDTSALSAANAAGTAKETSIASALPGQLAPLSTAYQNNLEGAVNAARTGQTAAGTQLASDVGDTSNKMFTDQANLVKQQQLDASTAAARSMRSNLAAGGNLNSGAGVAAAKSLATNTANNIQQGDTQLGVQSLAAKQQALSQAFTANSALVSQTLGINADEFKTLLNSGRQDLIDEATSLLGITQNDTSNQIAIGQLGQNRQIAQQVGNQQGQTDLTSAILSAMGTGIASRGQ